MGTGVSQALAAKFKAGFIQKCVEAIRLGHAQMLMDGLYQTHWEEDIITNCLVTAMRKTGFLRDEGLSVNLQVPIVTPAIAAGLASFITAPKVDFKFAIWPGNAQDELEYFAEAKNLSQRDWQKPSGAWVRTAHYRKRYLKTGIDNYLSGRYPEGCLVGYIVNGTTSAVVMGLNRLIKSSAISPRVGLLLPATGSSWTARYHSNNLPGGNPYPLIHLMLQL